LRGAMVVDLNDSIAFLLYTMRSPFHRQIFRKLALSTEGPNTELEKVGRTGDESWRDVGCGAWSELCHGEENWKKVINTWMQPLATWSQCGVDTTVQ